MRPTWSFHAFQTRIGLISIRHWSLKTKGKQSSMNQRFFYKIGGSIFPAKIGKRGHVLRINCLCVPFVTSFMALPLFWERRHPGEKKWPVFPSTKPLFPLLPLLSQVSIQKSHHHFHWTKKLLQIFIMLLLYPVRQSSPFQLGLVQWKTFFNFQRLLSFGDSWHAVLQGLKLWRNKVFQFRSHLKFFLKHYFHFF